MTYEELGQMLAASGYPVAYGYFKTEQAPPYVLYRFAYSNNLSADGEVYITVDHIQIELYTKTKDEEAEAAVEAQLSPTFFFQKSQEYDEDQKVYQTVYEIEVLKNARKQSSV